MESGLKTARILAVFLVGEAMTTQAPPEPALESEGTGQPTDFLADDSEETTEESVTEATVAAPTEVAPTIPSAPEAPIIGAEAARIQELETQVHRAAARQQAVESEAFETQRRLDHQMSVEADRKAAEAVAAYRTRLEQQGYAAEDVQRVTQEFGDLQQQRRAVDTERQELQLKAIAQEFNREAKWRFAQMFSSQYEVPVSELMKEKTVDAMELIGLKAQIAKGKQAQAPAQRFDNNRANPAVSGNRAARLDHLSNKAGLLTDAEHAEMEKLLGGGR